MEPTIIQLVEILVAAFGVTVVLVVLGSVRATFGKCSTCSGTGWCQECRSGSPRVCVECGGTGKRKWPRAE